MHLSLFGGVFSWLTVVVAAVLIVASLRPLDSHRRRLLAVTAIGAVAATGALEWESWAGDWIQPALPPVSYLWVWAVFFALGWTLIGWRSGAWKTRLLAPLATLASVVMALTLFNAYFFYYPTLQSLVGNPITNEVSARVLSQYQVSGQTHSASGRSALPPGALQHGVTVKVAYPPTISGFEARPGWVYLPPAWFGPERSKLPVILLVGGRPSLPDEWMRSGLANQTAAKFASRNGGKAPIIATVDSNGSLFGDTECVDRKGSMAETYLTVDVKVALIAQFQVSTKTRWAIAGLSEGGLCAETMALRHPSEFVAFGDFGGDPLPSVGDPATTLRVLFHGNKALSDAYNPAMLMDKHQSRAIWGMYVRGTGDGSKISMFEAARYAASRGMNVSCQLIRGGHTFEVWSSAFQSFLPFAWYAMTGELPKPPSSYFAVRRSELPGCIFPKS